MGTPLPHLAQEALLPRAPLLLIDYRSRFSQSATRTTLVPIVPIFNSSASPVPSTFI